MGNVKTQQRYEEMSKGARGETLHEEMGPWEGYIIRPDGGRRGRQMGHRSREAAQMGGRQGRWMDHRSKDAVQMGGNSLGFVKGTHV